MRLSEFMDLSKYTGGIFPADVNAAALIIYQYVLMQRLQARENAEQRN